MVINVQGVTKVYDGPGKSEVVANDNLDLHVKEGEILGLLGHNGAGKTTLVNQILGLTKPTRGDIDVLGQSVIQSPERARFICSVQPQSQLPFGELTPTQAVSIMGMMRGGKKDHVIKRMEKLFDALDIGSWANTLGTNLSGGVRRLTAFCMAVVTPGKVVILDEPTNDVDPVRRRYLWNEIRKLTEEGTSVILVTHNVLEAEKAVDRVAILHKGKFLIQGTPSEIKQSISNRLRIEVSLATDSANIEIPEWALSEYLNNGRMSLSMEQASALESIDWAKDQVEKGKIIDYSLSPTSLEDIYVELTEGKGGESI